jgi:hypothetical protein
MLVVIIALQIVGTSMHTSSVEVIIAEQYAAQVSSINEQLLYQKGKTLLSVTKLLSYLNLYPDKVLGNLNMG